MEYTLRDAAPADAAAIEVLLPRLADFELPQDRVPEDLWREDGRTFAAHLAGERPDCIARVAVDASGEVVGATLVSLRPEMLSGEPSSHLEALMIARSAEGAGLGRRLLDDAQEQAASRGAGSMTLHVFALNRRARRLYEGAGFDGEILRYRRKLSPSSTASATPDGAVEHPAFEWDHGEPPAEAADLLHFWFGASQPAEESPSRVAERQSKLWWQKDEATDREVRERFAPQLVPAERGDLDHWLRTPRGLLARVLLWDQVPRNVYRESPWAFAYDEGARRLTSLALERGADQLLSPIECLFLYLPLEHSESRSDQRRCVELFAALEARVPEDQRSVFEGFTGFARRHQEIVERFGRFPHRNQVLGRRSTVEEEEFLQQPGSSF